MLSKSFNGFVESFKIWRGLRKKFVGSAWRISGMDYYAAKAWRFLSVIIVIVFCLYLMSSHANARDAKAEQVKAEYVSALEKSLARCLGDSEGVLIIGEEYYFCRAIKIGEKK